MTTGKKVIIIAACVLAAGILICVLSMAVLGFDFSKLSISKLELMSYEVEDKFDNISVGNLSRDIEIVKSEDGKCRVDYYGSDKLTYDIKVENGTLKIDDKDERSWFDRLSFTFGSEKTVLYLPNQTYKDLTMDISTGDITVSKDFMFDQVDINGFTNDVFMNASAKKDINITVSTGDIHVSDLTAANMNLVVTTGDIEINGAALSQGDLTLSLSTGDSRLDNVNCVNINSTGSTGDDNYKNVIAKGEIHMERSTGDINLDECDAAMLYLKTTTGDINGVLNTEKIFFAETNTGDVNVPKTVNGGKCEMFTSTGDINMQVK